MNRTTIAIAAIFGLSIGLLLMLLQFARIHGWPPRTLDVYPAVVGLVFLLAGALLGARLHRSPPVGAGVSAAAEAGSANADPAAITGPLSRRERQVLAALAEGCSNAEIARRHFVSENTVKTQVRQICAKLEVSRRGQAVARARQLGLLQ